MLTALPDLASPITGIPGVAYRAFGLEGRVVAVPDRLKLEAEIDGRPRLLMTLIRGGESGVWSGGRIELGLSVEADLAGMGQALVTAGTPASLAVAELDEGVLTMTALLGPIAPTTLAPPQLLPPDLLTRARVVVDLGAEAASIAARLVEDATLPLDATLHLAHRAVAPRVPLVVTYDPRGIAERLAARMGPGAVIGVADFEAAIDALLGGADLGVVGDLQAIEPGLRARTVALRLRDRFAERAASDPGKLRLLPVERVPPGRERIDLMEPAAVVVERAISLDPLGAARAMRRGAIDDLVRRVEVPAVPTGRRRITLSANLPEPIAGLQALVADFRAPALPPFRPLEIAVSAPLDPPERRAEAELRLGPGEPIDGEVRLRAMVMKGGEIVEVTGPWRPTQRADVLLGPADFGAPLVVLRASPALTALAVVEVMAGEAVVARLDAATPMTAVPILNPPLRASARPLAGGDALEIDLGDRRRIDLDLATLPGFGAHRARLVTAEVRPLLVEWRAEGDAGQAPLSTWLSADRPAVEIGWIAASPFRPGVVWRAVRDGVPGPWSAPVLPREDLRIEVSAGASVDRAASSSPSDPPR